MRTNNELVANNVLSSGTSFSNVMLSEQWIRTSFQITCGSGSLVGTFTVQGSNDKPVGTPPNQFSPTNWNNIGSSQQVVCSFSVGTCALIPYFDTCYHWHRIQFVAGNLPNGWFSIRVESRNL